MEQEVQGTKCSYPPGAHASSFYTTLRVSGTVDSLSSSTEPPAVVSVGLSPESVLPRTNCTEGGIPLGMKGHQRCLQEVWMAFGHVSFCVHMNPYKVPSSVGWLELGVGREEV